MAGASNIANKNANKHLRNKMTEFVNGRHAFASSADNHSNRKIGDAIDDPVLEEFCKKQFGYGNNFTWISNDVPGPSRLTSRSRFTLKGNGEIELSAVEFQTKKSGGFAMPAVASPELKALTFTSACARKHKPAGLRALRLAIEQLGSHTFGQVPGNSRQTFTINVQSLFEIIKAKANEPTLHLKCTLCENLSSFKTAADFLKSRLIREFKDHQSYGRHEEEFGHREFIAGLMKLAYTINGNKKANGNVHANGNGNVMGGGDLGDLRRYVQHHKREYKVKKKRICDSKK